MSSKMTQAIAEHAVYWNFESMRSVQTVLGCTTTSEWHKQISDSKEYLAFGISVFQIAAKISRYYGLGRRAVVHTSSTIVQ